MMLTIAPPNRARRVVRAPLLVAAAAGALAAFGCRAPEPPPAPRPLLPPGHEVEQRTWVGSVIGAGSHSDRLYETSARHTPTVELRLIALEEAPALEGLPSLASCTRLVLDLEDDSPVVPASTLVPAARVARGDDARRLLQRIEAGDWNRFQVVDGSRAPLPLGASRMVGIRAVEEARDPDNFLGEYPPIGTIDKRLVLHVEHGAGAEPFAAALFVEDAGRPLPSQRALESAAGELPERAPRPLRELIVLDDPPRPGDPLAIVLASPFESGAARAWLAWVEVTPPPPPDERASDDHRDSFEHVIRTLESALRTDERVDRAEEQRVLLQALRELETTGDERAALVYLAGAAGAPLTEELALFAEDDVLTDLIQPIARAARELGESELPIGWVIERATALRLAARSIEGDLEPAILAALLRHTGEAGRYPSSIEQAARASTSLADFHATIVAENRIFLEDSNPSARVRAYDWLVADGSAPAGYDPLAPRAERRSALAAEEAP